MRYRASQCGQLAELQTGKIVLQRWILIDDLSRGATEGTRRSTHARLLAEVDSRWDLDREENTDASNRPLANYDGCGGRGGGRQNKAYIGKSESEMKRGAGK